MKATMVMTMMTDWVRRLDAAAPLEVRSNSEGVSSRRTGAGAAAAARPSFSSFKDRLGTGLTSGCVEGRAGDPA